MNRTQIQDEHKWDLSPMFENQPAFHTMIEDCKTLLTTLVTLGDTFCESADAFSTFMNEYERFQRQLSHCYTFAKMSTDV
ncbi:MAG: hypothetical protein ACRDBX_06090 [Erysipelotrichaceae bacterium]